MKHFFSLLLISVLLIACQPPAQPDEWLDLFNGKDLSGWKANENAASFRVENGLLVANGERSHLFYTGTGDTAPEFKNFELALDIMTHALANSGVYIHTRYQEEGWPEKGNEIQVNNSHIGGGDYRELKKGGSMYGTRNVYKAFAKDSAWYHMRVRVEGKHLQVWIDSVQTVDYFEPENPLESGISENHLLTSGTIAIQGHDPLSKVFFKNIRLKVLPDRVGEVGKPAVFGEWEQKVLAYQGRQFAFADLKVPSQTGRDLESAIRDAYHTGINLGVVVDAQQFGPEEMADWNAALAQAPVFKGMLIREAGITEGVSVEVLNAFDYVIQELAPYPGIESDDPEAYMDAYVNWLVDDLELGGCNIWGKASQLPAALAGQYETLWTPARMNRVIDAAKASHIAIEIDNQKKLPGLPFLKIAKEKGCQFSFSGIRTAEVAGGSHYVFEVIDSLDLNYKDLFIPGAIHNQE